MKTTPRIKRISSRRAKVYAQRGERILSAADLLFKENGFDETSVESIARAAEVSVPTIYKYFASKNDFLLVLFARDKNRIPTQLRRAMRNSVEQCAEDIASLAIMTLAEGYDLREKEIWRRILAVELRATAQQRREMLYIQERQAEALRLFLHALQSEGVISEKTAVRSFARAILAIARNNLRSYIMSDAMGLDELNTMTTEDVAMAFHGLRDW